MSILNGFRRQKIDRIKDRVRKETARYYINKNKRDTKVFQYLFDLQIKQEKKNLMTFYEERIKSLNEELERARDEIGWHKKEWKDYKDLKEELERIAASIDINHLRLKFNHFLSVFDYAKDKIEIIGLKHDKRKLIGVK